MDLADVSRLAARLEEHVGRVIVGQRDAVRLLLVALLSEGHVLLEGLPGTAKTLLARAFARGLDLRTRRVQFTPDLLPGDIVGSNLFDFASNTFRLVEGPIFTQVLLADEINRTPPKTQAALLEAMQERSVTLDGETHDLGDGFFVVATQNPLEHEGTYPLPEAQLDRFLVRVLIEHPAVDEERAMVRRHGHTSQPDLDALLGPPVATLDDVRAARRTVSALTLSDDVLDYAVDLVRATREHPLLLAGASPRATNMLALACRAAAALDGRDYALPDDMKALAGPVLAHRHVRAPAAELEGLSTADVLGQVVEQTAAPR